MVFGIDSIERVSNLLFFDLFREKGGIGDDHVPEEVPALLGGVSLQNDVQVSELPVAIPHTRVHVRYVQRTAENVVVNQEYFLMVSSENIGYMERSQMSPKLPEGVIPNHHTSTCFKLPTLFLICIEIEIINNKVDFDPAFASIL